MSKKFKLAGIVSAAVLSLGVMVGFVSTASATEAPAPAAQQAQVPFKPGGLVLVFTDEGEILTGRFIGQADVDPENFVLVAVVGEGVVRAPLYAVVPLPGPGNSSGGN